MTKPAIQLQGINKRFGAVHANKDIDLAVMPGTIHGIVGENGAGKSTLMSILYGFYQADSGTIEMDGKPVTIKDSQDAISQALAWFTSTLCWWKPSLCWKTSCWAQKATGC